MSFNTKLILIIIFTFLVTCVFPQPSPIRVACIGNSITEGDGLVDPETQTYPVQLSKLLGDQYDVKNFGVSGRTMIKRGDWPYWNESAFTEALNFEPDIVTILLGTNDSRTVNQPYIDDDFYSDYQAMIDTFAQLESSPKIWLCLPPPSFSDYYTINDSIIVNKIIPIINQLFEDNPATSLIDFYNTMLDKAHLFPDGIHPGLEGASVMARMIYEHLTGQEFEKIKDTDVLRDKPVSASGYNDETTPPQAINDGDRRTFWQNSGFPSWVVFDIEDIQNIDMFQLDFGKESNRGYQYTVETSTDSIIWELVIDRSANEDTTALVNIDKIEPKDVQYIRLNITGAFNSTSETFAVRDFRALKNTHAFHAPILIVGAQTRYRYDVHLVPSTNDGESFIFYKAYGKNKDYTVLTEYVSTDFEKVVVSCRGDTTYAWVMATKDGRDIISDSIWVNQPELTNVTKNKIDYPDNFMLQQNYPNPFNSFTNIEFTIPVKSNIKLSVYNILGQQVAVLVQGIQNAGIHSISFNGGNLFSSTYFYRLEAKNQVKTKKMLLLK